MCGEAAANEREEEEGWDGWAESSAIVKMNFFSIAVAKTHQLL